MKIETIMNAMVRAELVKNEIVRRLSSLNMDSSAYRFYIREHEKRYRQYRTFRARILKMFEELEEEIEYLVEYGNR